jgi:hypothetical protein
MGIIEGLRASDVARSAGDFTGALRVIDTTLATAGDDTALRLARVHLLRECGRLQESLAEVDDLLKKRPFLAEAHLASGFLRLLSGDWSQGWAQREWRWHRPEYRRSMPPSLPVWDGSDSPKLRLRVIHEQGLGDALQFSRFFREIRQRVGSLEVETPPALMGLMTHAFPEIDSLVVPGAPTTADAWIGLMSLPERLQVTPATIPHASGYLRLPTPALPESPIKLLEPVPDRPRRLQIGLAPAGNPNHANDRFRTPPTEVFSALCHSVDADWWWVQPEVPDRLLNTLPVQAPPWPLNDFTDTARWMAVLDLVISVDTSAAHLAGALGRPTWILLPFAPDWRWGAAGTTTPWYDAARLYRQARPLDWDSALQSLITDLQSL